MKKFLFTSMTTIAIVVLSTIPVPEMPQLQSVPFFDKWAHMVMYAGLVFSMWLDMWLTTRRTGKEPSMLFGVMTNVYPASLGGAMELVQAYCTTCRSGDYMDFLADCVGTYLGVIICVMIWKIAKTSAVR